MGFHLWAVAKFNADMFLRDVLPLVSSAHFKTITVGHTVESFANTLPRFSSSANADNDKLVVLIADSAAAEILKSIPDGTRERLVWIHSLFTGVDAFQLDSVADLISHVPVTNSRGAFSLPLAEHVLLSCLYFNRQVHKMRHATSVWDRYPSPVLQQQSMGIIGYGEIGQVCAKHLVGFGMRVTGLRKRPVQLGSSSDAVGVRVVSGDDALETMLKESDFILNLLPLTSESRKFFNRDVFRRMKKECVFINIGRGATVDEDALVDALQEGTIKGAAVDVFEQEPLPSNSPLWKVVETQKLLLTPHNANIFPGICEFAGGQFADFAKKFVECGELPSYRVDVRRGY